MMQKTIYTISPPITDRVVHKIPVPTQHSAECSQLSDLVTSLSDSTSLATTCSFMVVVPCPLSELFMMINIHHNINRSSILLLY